MDATLLASLTQKVQAALDPETVSSHLAMHQVVQDLVADAPGYVLVADRHAQLIAASRQMLRLIGHTLRSIRELNVTELAAAEDTVDAERLWESFLRQRRQSGHFALRHRDGRVIRTDYVAVGNLVGGLSIAVHTPVAVHHHDSADHAGH